MSQPIPKLISIDRVKTLLDCYGSDPCLWPEAEQQAAIALLKQSEELQSIQHKERDLDRILRSTLDEDNLEVPDSLLIKLSTDLPAQEQASSHTSKAIWLRRSGSIAALLFIALGIALMNETPDPRSLELTEFDQWAMAEMSNYDELDRPNIELDVALLIGFEDIAL